MNNGSRIKTIGGESAVSAIALPAIAATMLALANTPAQAHFAWLVLAEDGGSVEVYFSEDATSNDAGLLDYVAGAKLWQVAGDDVRPLPLKQSEDALSAPLPGAGGRKRLVVLRHELGVIERQGETFLLNYYAKAGPTLRHAAWKNPAPRKLVDLDILPQPHGEDVRLRVLWQGKPAAGAQVVIAGPGVKNIETETNDQGEAEFSPHKPGLYSIRARHIEKRSGTADGKKFNSVRHYATLALPIAEARSKQAPAADDNSRAKPYPDLPAALTSFGAAVLGKHVYAYGGHTGEAHSYSNTEQSNELIRLNLENPTGWKTVARGPRLQGLALIAAGDKLYRLGGFTAKNDKGDDHDLWSQPDVAIFDPAQQQWQDGPPLPEPRSSFDAAVVDGAIYVVGGWRLRGDQKTRWHETAWRLDPRADKPQWEPLPKPPFQRRALALAAHAGKLYVLGGMKKSGGPTTRVDVFDPQTSQWTRGPDLPGKPMEGFGCSGFAMDGRLYVSTVGGSLLRLSADGKSWQELRALETARFFHRMLPIGNRKLMMLGGANMEIGKFDHVDVVTVKP